jgi:hypothetical protein
MGEVLAAQGHLEEALEHDPAVISDYVDQDISSKDANDILSDDQPEVCCCCYKTNEQAV